MPPWAKGAAHSAGGFVLGTVLISCGSIQRPHTPRSTQTHRSYI